MIFRTFFLLFTASVRSRPPGPPAVPGVFWTCCYVQNFWELVTTWVVGFGIDLNLSNRIVLFGFLKEPTTSIINLILIYGKAYIWKNKFKNIDLSMTHFKNFLKRKLEDDKHSFEYLEKNELFDQWNNIYASLQYNV